MKACDLHGSGVLVTWDGSGDIVNEDCPMCELEKEAAHLRHENEQLAKGLQEAHSAISVILVPRLEPDQNKLRLARLIELAGFAESLGDAARLIAQGAVKFADTTIMDPDGMVSVFDGAILQVGRTCMGRVKLDS